MAQKIQAVSERCRQAPQPSNTNAATRIDKEICPEAWLSGSNNPTQ
jgi:hypothetical protein